MFNLPGFNDAILPLISDEYAIFYKAGEFSLSPTYFIDGLSAKLWGFIWSFFFLFFVGLLISIKTYEKYFKTHRVSVGDVAMYQMNFVANQSHILATNQHEKFFSWRIQVICQAVFQIIIACAFSAFILALLSIKTTERKFESLDDFTIKKTHVICDSPYSTTNLFFLDIISRKFIVKPKFKGIYNQDLCWNIFIEKTDQSICEAVKPVAFVSSNDYFRE